jgi:hypothetical protein
VDIIETIGNAVTLASEKAIPNEKLLPKHMIHANHGNWSDTHTFYSIILGTPDDDQADLVERQVPLDRFGRKPEAGQNPDRLPDGEDVSETES